MDLAGYRAALRREGDLLAAALPRVDQHAHPPGCPDWRVVDVVRHLGYVHRWAAAVVRERRADGEVDVADDGAGISGPALVDWFRAGHDALLRELAACDPAAVFFAFLPAPSALHFWSRRQTHETGIHRTDVESAGGLVTPFPAEQAVDGIEEILTGFAARPRPRWRGPERSLGLLASDPGTPGWLVRIGSDGARVERGDEDATTAECVVRGGASDLDLLLWNRIDPAGLDVRGDPGVLDAWRGTVRVRWTGPAPPGTGRDAPH
jgi:uncharacterized protein (TIGR03083 family)